MSLIVVHGGFHKTGTTTVQQALRQNAALLAPEIQVILNEDMKALCEAARAFSIHQDPLDMSLLHLEAANFFAGLDASDPRPILLSSEDLTGHMPGRHGLKRYSAAPLIMQAISQVAAEMLPNLAQHYYFSTRAPAAWVNSCYGQHVIATRMTEGFDDYRRAAIKNAQLSEIVGEITAALPEYSLTSSALEDSTTLPLGPLTPLLDLINIPANLRANLSPPLRARETQSPEILAELLALNRSSLDDEALKTAKRAVLHTSKDSLS